jgi:hypothetical protein
MMRALEKVERQILRKKRRLLFGLFYALLISWAPFTYAGETAELKGPFQKGATEWGLGIGFGDNFHISTDIKEDIQYYFLNLSWGKILKEWERSGSLEFLTEGFLAYSRQDSKDRYAVGITPLFSYDFKSFGKAIPFLELGVGVLYTSLNPKHFGSHFNFTPQGGVGFRYAIARDTFVKLSYRIHHILNAGLSEDNRGIDSHLFSLGLSIFR